VRAIEIARRHTWAHFRTRYTRSLEDEVARLRAENRALVNSILGVAGIPPIRRISVGTVGEQKHPVGAGLQTRPGAAEASPLQHPDNRASVANGAPLVAPLRKRSWQQIGRVREIEDARAARREREANTETFPTPRSVIPRL